ncbi:uncharacterized protein G2W53_014978 [Senna tora]|uniref:Uncharacterized protein n=1 Tax=Senna tora TaxID=362788 RepID=A0A834WUL7_9FABA|nr:uncharacterized protein G2W53_014978 [Senna tora]
MKAVNVHLWLVLWILAHNYGFDGLLAVVLDTELSYLTIIYPNKFIGRFSLSRSTSQTRSSATKLSPSKEDPWPLDISLGAVVSLHQISWRRRLVAADLAGENVEVLRESDGEEASSRRRRGSVGLEVREGNLLPTLFRIFHRFLSCAASVDVVDEKDY